MGQEIFTEQLLLQISPIDGAVESLKRLANKYNIYIITARTEEMITHVRKWLKKYNLETLITNIISSSFEDKQDICIRNDIDFLCDDDFRHLKVEKIKCRVLFGNYDEAKGVLIAKSWAQIEEILYYNNLD